MTPDLVLTIPGPWNDRSDFLRRVVTHEPMGRYMFAGAVLADIQAKDHVPLEFGDSDPRIPETFALAGRGSVPPPVLASLRDHRSILFLHFPLDLLDQRERILKFTQLAQRVGGIAIKVESTGIAHTWEGWFAAMSGSPFDMYAATVTLVGDEHYYYSCGMHLFGLPDCELSTSFGVTQAADQMNQFNYWRILERPALNTGHTFSVAPDAPRFRLALEHDSRHAPDDLFHNPHGLWRLHAA